MASARSWSEIAALLQPLAKAERGSQKRASLRTGADEYEISRFLSGKAIPDPVIGAQLVQMFGLDFGEVSGLGPLGSVQPVVAHTPEGGGRELHGIGAPLVAEDVAAGEGSLPSVPDEKVYFFHESFLRRVGGAGSPKDRWACVRLGSDRVASSMSPTIPPKAVLLVDRRADRLHPRDRTIWLVDDPEDGLCVKRVTLRHGILILESDNPEARFAPRHVLLADRPVQNVVKAKVVWWGVEAAHHGG
ncbi:MAG: S24 family peptidase [Elusimicrobiota bacterium]|jgi:hypothetical protein